MLRTVIALFLVGLLSSNMVLGVSNIISSHTFLYQMCDGEPSGSEEEEIKSEKDEIYDHYLNSALLVSATSAAYAAHLSYYFPGASIKNTGPPPR